MGRVLTHPCNLLLIFGVLLLSFIGWSLPLLLAGLGLEIGLLAIAPWGRFLRRRVDAQLDEADRAAAAKARDALVQQMDVRHQQELGRLERLIDRTRENLDRRTCGALSARGHGLDPGRLTASYIRLAIAHRAGQESLAMTSYHELTDTIRALEAVRVASNDRMRELAERRLAIAYRRVECWCRTREGLEAIAQQLATILELVQLMHEQSLTPMDPHSACAEIERFMREIEENEGTLREIAEIAASNDLDLDGLDVEPAASGPRHHAAAQ
jgi:Asp-tRNA(Asn)/Glu-tRNA(Gln) amidotransferase C subunit